MDAAVKYPRVPRTAFTGRRWASPGAWWKPWKMLAGAALALVAAVPVAPRARVTADDAPLLFDVPLRSCSYGGAAVADLDGDGQREVVFGTYYNDERLIALRADGTVLWAVSSGGGPIDNSVTVADLDGDARPEVVWGNSEDTRLHVADATGRDRWSKVIGEVLDAPKAVADVDGDGRLDLVVASCGASGRAGGLRAFVGATGELLWTASVGGCYQSAPLLFDQDGDGLLDVVVSTWFDEHVRAFSGRDGRLRWETPIGGWTYHAGSFGDLSGDGVPDVVLGDYSATVWALDGRSGTVLWSRKLSDERYLFGPTAMGDMDGDGALEIAVSGDHLRVFDRTGRERWSKPLDGYATRGPVLTDMDADGRPDILVAVDGPALAAYRGSDGAALFTRTFPQSASADHHPVVADLDGDGRLEAFLIYGRGQSDTPEQNWGRAVAVRLGATGPEWPTFSHDLHHSGNYGRPAGGAVNPSPTPGAGTAATPRATATGTAGATATAPVTGTSTTTTDTATPTVTGTLSPTATLTPTRPDATASATVLPTPVPPSVVLPWVARGGADVGRGALRDGGDRGRMGR
jgi:hypothetical protein